jgi:hypothetical protein
MMFQLHSVLISGTDVEEENTWGQQGEGRTLLYDILFRHDQQTACKSTAAHH